MTPITDPALIQQLDAAPAPAALPTGMTAADPATAAALDAMATPASQAPITWQDRLNSVLGNQAAGQKVMGAETSALRNSSLGGVAMGLRDPIDQGAAMLSKLIGSPAQQAATAQANKAAETNYEQNWRQGQPPGFDGGRLLGNMLATAPLAYAMPGAGAAGLGARMLSGAASGAASGALQPVDPTAPDFWRKTAQNAGVGAAGGAVAPAILGAASRILRPNVSPDVQTLMNAGIRPTPGQIMGGTPNRWEEQISSIPVLGDFIKTGRARAMQQFNQGAINQALAPIGQSLQAPLGRDAISEMQSKIGDAYDSLVPNLSLTPSVNKVGAGVGSMGAADPVGVLNTNLNSILNMSAFMPPDRAAQLKGIIQRSVYDRMSPYGGMSGQSFQDAKSELGKLSSDYLNSSSADERQLGGALLQTQVAMRNALRAANPQAAAQLSATDNAFAQSLRINNAAARPGAEPGVFSPAQLQAATKSLDPSLRKHVFAAGDALMQNYAEAGKSVLGNKVPDSGTAGRSLMGLATAAALGHLALPPGMAIGGAGGGLAAMGAYSRPGQAALANLMTRGPLGRTVGAPLATGLRAVAPAASTAFSPAWGALVGP